MGRWFGYRREGDEDTLGSWVNVPRSCENLNEHERKVEFRIDLVPKAKSAVKSRYRLTPLEMQELSEQLRELQDKDNSKEWNSSEDKLRLRWMIYLVVLVDVAESVRDTIGFEYCLASSSGWTKLRLPKELSCVHDTFHVSNLEKKCLADASLHVSLDEIKVDKTLRFVKEPVENSDRDVKRFLTSLLDDGRGSGSWMFLFVWSGYAAMRTLLWAGKVVSSKISCEKLNLLVKSRDENSLRRGDCDNHDFSRFVLVFVEAAKHQVSFIVPFLLCFLGMEMMQIFAYFVGKILGGDQLLVILCGYGTKSLELGTSFLSMTMLL
ncbi:hypothetical protein Tco_1419604 [Tanacetum coccineum]